MRIINKRNINVYATIDMWEYAVESNFCPSLDEIEDFLITTCEPDLVKRSYWTTLTHLQKCKPENKYRARIQHIAYEHGLIFVCMSRFKIIIDQ